MPVIAMKGAPELNAARDAPDLEEVKWWTLPNMRKLYFWAAVLCIASATTGYDGMMLNTSQNLDEWQLYFDEPTGSKLGLMNAIYMIGSIVGFLPVPFLADRYGRRLPIAIGCVFMILGGCLGAFCNNYGMYVGGRLILGFGNSLAQMASPVLLTEICHPQHRAKVTTIYNCLWNLGALVVAWIAWGTMEIKNDWSWRSITLLQIGPAVIQLTFIYWVPESPRWFIAQERHDEALSILAYYHAEGDAQNPTVQFEFQEIKETLRLEMEYARTSSYLDFLRTRGNRYRLMLLISQGLISQYSGNALFSNYTNLIYTSMGFTEQSQKIPLNGGQTLVSLIFSVSAAFFVDRVGRRPLFLSATAGMFFMFLAWTITSSQYERTGHVSAAYPQVVFIYLFNMFYSLAWSGLLVAYSLEILPYKLRAKGLLIMNMTVQSILVLSNQTNPIAWDNMPQNWNLSAFYTCWIAVEFVFVYFFYVETKGPTLEELAKIFDGDEAAVGEVDIKKIEEHIIHTDEKPAA
ncbi:hypothetical protein AJ79_02636 [Helicocarpus griseus UAMH5409]|uniref:Major facilitator superfamily (MFS) profile domain-containing protein n=1 Tax=Helicocarpus griseus UAMH5409 TaxID=1447875 RepID=A0A2B7Y1F6_9EURO|nr:hypothetical protein AJ79_02636 [Helicocarpus griseus UAMH5409]